MSALLSQASPCFDARIFHASLGGGVCSTRGTPVAEASRVQHDTDDFDAIVLLAFLQLHSVSEPFEIGRWQRIAVDHDAPDFGVVALAVPGNTEEFGVKHSSLQKCLVSSFPYPRTVATRCVGAQAITCEPSMGREGMPLGAFPPPQVSHLQSRAAVARRSHKPEVASSSLAPATSFVSARARVVGRESNPPALPEPQGPP